MTDRHFSTLRASYDVQRLSHWRSLRNALRQSIDDAPSTHDERDVTDGLLLDAIRDIVCDPVRVRPYVEAALDRHGLSPSDREVRFNAEFVDGAGTFGGAGRYGYVVDTDVQRAFGVDRGRATAVTESVFHGIAAELYRIHNMSHFRALVPFSRSDTAVYRAHLDFVTRQTDPATPSDTFSRIVDIGGAPNLRHPGVAQGVNLHHLLEARRSPEAVEFREWVWTAADLSDAEIREQLEHHVQSMGRTLSVLLRAPAGRRLRWVAATGVGMAATAAAGVADPVTAAAAVIAANAAAAGISYADSFLVDKVVPAAGRPPAPAAFVSDGYPSIFRLLSRDNETTA